MVAALRTAEQHVQAAHQEVLHDWQRAAARLPADAPHPPAPQPPAVKLQGGQLSVRIPLDAQQAASGALLPQLDAVLWQSRARGTSSAISSSAQHSPARTTYSWSIKTHGTEGGDEPASGSSAAPLCPLPGPGPIIGGAASTLTVKASLGRDQPGAGAGDSWLLFQKSGRGFTPGELALVTAAMQLAAGVGAPPPQAQGLPLPPWLRPGGPELPSIEQVFSEEMRRAIGEALGEAARHLRGFPMPPGIAGEDAKAHVPAGDEFLRWLDDVMGGSWGLDDERQEGDMPQLVFPAEPLPGASPKQLPTGAQGFEWGSHAAERAVKDLQSMGCTVIPPGNKDTTDWGMLAGYDDAKQQLEDCLLLPLQHPEVYEQVAAKTRGTKQGGVPGSSRPRAVLFEGPPGTGKTTSARVIGAQAAVPLVYCPLEAVVSKWYGESEQNLGKVFKLARQLGGCIIFLDELDSLGANREDGSSHEASRRLLSVMLREIDGFETGERRSIVIGATNRKIDLDAALLSRFDMSIHFPLPDEACRAAILSQYAQQLTPDELKQLADNTPGFSGRDLRDVCEQTERRWAAKVIRGQAPADQAPPMAEYLDAAAARMAHAESTRGAGVWPGFGRRAAAVQLPRTSL